MFWKLFLLCFSLVFIAFLSQHVFLRFLSSSQALRHLYLQEWQQTVMQDSLRAALATDELNNLPDKTVSDSLQPFLQPQGYEIDYQGLPYLTLYIDTLVVVDKSGALVTQLGQPIYQQQNLFTEMSLHGREDLVEALIGKDYFGTSVLPDYPGVVVAISLFDSQKNIVGAMVSHQRRELAPGSNGIWFGIQAVAKGMFQVQADFIVNLFFASLIFSLVITFYLRKRVTKITATVKQWKKANFKSSIQDSSLDELGECAKQLNDMSISLKNAMHQAQQNASYKERLQLAGVLHDTVKQRLFVVNLKAAVFEKLKLQQQSEQQLDTVIADISNQCQLAYEELEQVISESKPKSLIRFSELEQYLINNRIASDLKLVVNVEPTLSQEMVPEIVLRLINEALKNTLKHAKATSSLVSICSNKDNYIVDISDDGIGDVFKDNELIQRGQGLALLQQSIIDSGGVLKVNDNLESGFSLQASIPNNKVTTERL